MQINRKISNRRLGWHFIPMPLYQQARKKTLSDLISICIYLIGQVSLYLHQSHIGRLDLPWFANTHYPRDLIHTGELNLYINSQFSQKAGKKGKVQDSQGHLPQGGIFIKTILRLYQDMENKCEWEKTAKNQKLKILSLRCRLQVVEYCQVHSFSLIQCKYYSLCVHNKLSNSFPHVDNILSRQHLQ